MVHFIRTPSLNQITNVPLSAEDYKINRLCLSSPEQSVGVNVTQRSVMSKEMCEQLHCLEWLAGDVGESKLIPL